jgi:hypothetical protein
MTIWLVLLELSVLVSFVIFLVIRMKKKANKRQKAEQEISDRQKEFRALARDLCCEIVDPLKGAPNLEKGSTLDSWLEPYRYQEGDAWREVDRIVIKFSFVGTQDQFERTKAQYVVPAISEFLKENPNILVRLDSNFQLIAE